VQTFLLYPGICGIEQTAMVLDRQRLGKQRVEAKQILMANTGMSTAYKNHPACKMWRGCDDGLAYYGIAMCDEWIARGYKDTTREFFVDFLNAQNSNKAFFPMWIFREDFVNVHRGVLMHKNPTHYNKVFPGLVPIAPVGKSYPYIWPGVPENRIYMQIQGRIP